MEANQVDMNQFSQNQAILQLNAETHGTGGNSHLQVMTSSGIFRSQYENPGAMLAALRDQKATFTPHAK